MISHDGSEIACSSKMLLLPLFLITSAVYLLLHLFIKQVLKATSGPGLEPDCLLTTVSLLTICRMWFYEGFFFFLTFIENTNKNKLIY